MNIALIVAGLSFALTFVGAAYIAKAIDWLGDYNGG